MQKLLEILNDIKPGVDFSTQTGLVDSGILTSFDIMRLVMDISNEYDIEISPLSVVPENFNSVQSMMELIEKIQDEE